MGNGGRCYLLNLWKIFHFNKSHHWFLLLTEEYHLCHLFFAFIKSNTIRTSYPAPHDPCQNKTIHIHNLATSCQPCLQALNGLTNDNGSVPSYLWQYTLSARLPGRGACRFKRRSRLPAKRRCFYTGYRQPWLAEFCKGLTEPAGTICFNRKIILCNASKNMLIILS